MRNAQPTLWSVSTGSNIVQCFKFNIVASETTLQLDSATNLLIILENISFESWMDINKRLNQCPSTFRLTPLNHRHPSIGLKQLNLTKSIMSHWLSLLSLLAVVVVFESHTAAAQITFSKDWRAGGKRSESSTSFTSTLHARGLSLLDVPCEQLETYSTSKIRDLVRKEAVALLQCETTIGTKSDHPHNSNPDI